MSSTPGQLSALDWKSIGWTALTTAGAAIITVAVDQLLPQMQQEGIITASVMMLATTALHALRKFLTDTTPKS